MYIALRAFVWRRTYVCAQVRAWIGQLKGILLVGCPGTAEYVRIPGMLFSDSIEILSML